MSADDYREPQSSTTPANGPHSIRFSKRVLLVAVVALLVFCACLYSPMALEQLLLGWIYFPFRVLPQVSVDWPSAVLGIVSTLLLVVTMHFLLRRVFRRASSGAGRSISMRESVACTLALFLLFAAGTAMVGATHQVVWLITGRTTYSDASSPPVLGAIAQARAAAQRSQQRNNLRQLGLAMANFADVYEVLPSGGTVDERGRLMHGWAIFLGNYTDYSNSQIDFAVPWNEPPNDRLYKCALPCYVNPAIPEIFDRDGYGLSHIAANIQVFPIVTVSRESPSAGWDATEALHGRGSSQPNDSRLRSRELRRGAANLFLVGESAGNFKPWGHPANVRDPNMGIGKSLEGFGGPPGAGGAQVLMADGSVRFLNNETDRTVLESLARPTVDDSDDSEDGVVPP